ncbi:nicotinate-nucleotide--dimethylbenzimidazole phosphoribosyltransferase [Faecalibacterium sp. An121]|uniref:nicotinate-nucleotide--dimethylbenzimidazole phosphoribosyltransferase n=1 Tax=Faecalibacterium sp. An121 TaxID=1965550 RepID=UPI000B39A0B6|nr:nicotinate-nucleotide--dimethylbenzimidazole phosphoribosyltransferase [Faecalibacterium sp. An121]OUQ38883.1 nicotinate-nucleotide--dimethylbenzimidazole phosphoribosyltransferase [Faecalibacterium sp. An121]
MKRFDTIEQLCRAAGAPADDTARAQAHSRWQSLAHPLGSLGLLETMLEDAAALTGSPRLDFSRRAVLVFCADNGVVAQGVTQTGPEATAAVARGLGAGQSPVCRMAAAARCEVVPVDMGILDFAGAPGVLSRRVGNGTGDITRGPAMTAAQVRQAILTGAELAAGQAAAGVRLLATGEMGIGNTTTSAAVACALLGRPARDFTGRGAGLSDAGLARKVAAVTRALEVNRPDPADPLDVLAKVGGFDIAGMCGAFLGGAACGVPVLADGLISTVAALCAVRLCPGAAKAVFASHVSAEPAARAVLQALGKTPLLTAGLRLGEGTGAVACIPLWDMARAVYAESYSFETCGVKAYQPQEGGL